MAFNTSRFLKFLLLAVILSAAAVAQDAGCPDGTPGECANPDITSEVASDVDNANVEEASVESSPPEPQDPKCPSRPHIIRCAAMHLDTNRNNKLDRPELEHAIEQLSWLARGVLKIIGSVNSIMKKCDYDGDDAISIDYDMENTADTCLATCFKRRAFKSAFFPECDL
jgi:hypothetical protein